MSGWRLAVVLLVMFAAGYTLRSWMCLIRCEETHIRMYRRLLVAEANQDAYEQAGRVVDEAERITRGEP